jgi:threonylcarbamoyladenosine tRNA methylthiotransferase MtaB
MKINLITLGCKVNLIDSLNLKTQLEKLDFEVLNNSKEKNKFDFTIINTCTVTNKAHQKSIEKLKSNLINSKKIILTGCDLKINSKIYQEKFKDILILKDISKVIEYFKELNCEPGLPGLGSGYTGLESFKGNIRTRKYVSIQNGCDTFCSYCIVPFVRGKSVSRDLKEIIKEIQQAEQNGYQEIVLSGINLGAYGSPKTTQPEKNNLSKLLAEIIGRTRIPRIRLSSIGAQFIAFDNLFFEIFKNKRVCNHLHLSIQSGSDRILKKMNRNHDTKTILKAAQKAISVKKNTAITGDFIVGFPGETETDFEASLALAQKIPMAKLHIFPFSKRKKTKASHFKNQIDEKTKIKRVQIFQNLAKKLRKNFIQNNLGQIHPVLFEQNQKGYTPNYIQVFDKTAKANEIKLVRLSEENVTGG